MNKKQWIEWLKQININKKSTWITQDKIQEDKILISPYNLFQINDSYYIFMSESGQTYFIKSLRWSALFDKENNPKEIEYKINSKKITEHGIELLKFQESVKPSDPALQEKITEWIKHIEREGLTQELDKVNLTPGTIVQYSPFHFKEVKDNKIFFRTKENQQIYLAISVMPLYNVSLKKQLEEGTSTNKYILPLKSIPGYFRLVSENVWNKYQENNPLIETTSNIKNAQIKTIKQKPVAGQHINNIWGAETSMEFENIELDPIQKNAHDTSIKNKFSIINGYAGTGKSVVVKMISNTLINDGWIVSRLSPTGRAAQLINGKTIHSWLEPIIRKSSGTRYEIDGYAKLKMQEKECLIIDEASMIDTEIWNEIIRVWNNSKETENKKIILVGDEGQLEPVGKGEPFLNYIRQDKTPITNLKTLHRNINNQALSIFSEYVRTHGKLDRSFNSPSVVFISKEEAFERVMNQSIQMITPKRNGEQGSLEINKEIKEKMNSSTTKPAFYTLVYDQDPGSRFWKKIEDTPVHINDKIIIVRNMWEWNITNGTTGIFLGEERIRLYNHATNTYSTNKMCYKFQNPESKKIFYLPRTQETRLKIELAYAITIHKSQGSEYSSLILFLNNSYVDPKMLYTGVTRAKETIYIVA